MEETSHGGSELPILFGARYSAYVQAVRLSLEEKGVLYAIEDVDVFARTQPTLEDNDDEKLLARRIAG